MLQNENELNDFLQKTILNDLDTRSINGSYIYLAAWLLIGAGSGFYKDNLLYYWLTAGIFLLLGVIRIITHLYYSKSRHCSQTIRSKWNYFNILMPALVYSLLLALAFYGPPFKDVFLHVLLTIFALLSAGTVNFSLNRKLACTFIFTLTTLPFIVAVFFTPNSQVLGLMLGLFAFYMLIQAIQLNKEYILRMQQQFTLDRLNRIDSLTNIGNRRQFDESIELLWQTSLRSHTTLSLIIIDIDNFKRVNDQFGHAAGDDVIKRIAEIIQSICKRDTDVVTRIGGEEYAILLNGDDQQKNSSVAESIRASIESQKFEFDHVQTKITVSIGLACTVPTVDKAVAEFFKVADKNLYSAKSLGRNQVVVSDY